MKRLLVAVVVLLATYTLWPVGGRIWRQSQVTGVELTRMGTTFVTLHPSAIEEALGEARLQRLYIFHRHPCHPKTITFLTESGRVPINLKCPSGFFLDFVGPN